MASFNNVVLMGNLTRDPEVKTLPSGIPVARIGMAMDRKWRDKNEELKSEVTFVDVESFGKTAEVVSRYLKKGEPVLIEGRLRYSSWDAKDGSGKRSKVDVVAQEVRLLPRRGGPGEGAAGGGGYAGGYASAGLAGRGDPVFPGEFPAHAAAGLEDAEGEEFGGADFEGGMPDEQ